MVGVALENVTKCFTDPHTGGEVVALDHLDLAVAPGELCSVVGPSGCGKSTVLRLVAGLDDPTEGRVLIGHRDVTRVPTRSRNVGIVTQSDTLLGHRTGRRNIRLPLEMRTDSLTEPADRLVDRQAGELGIEALLDRRPAELSSGQRRALQIARALVARPDVLLLDEPLAFMDDGFRRRLRADVVEVQRRHGVTTVLVTADHTDAVTMSDRIAVLIAGQLHQVGTPIDVVERPASTQVAAFFGDPPMNLVAARVRRVAGDRMVSVLGCEIRAWSPLLDVYHGKEVLVGVRPLDLAPGPSDHPTVSARVVTTAPLGHRTDVTARVAQGAEVTVTVAGPPPRPGSEIEVQVRPDRFHWFDPATGLAVLHPATP